VNALARVLDRERPALGAALVLAFGALCAGQEPAAPPDDPDESQAGPRAERTALPLRLEAARDATGEGLAFVELAVEARQCYVQQRVPVTLRFGMEEEFLRTQAIQPFGPRLDVPVQVVATWLEGLSGARALGLSEPPLEGDGRARPTFALNQEVRHALPAADRVEGDRRFRVYSVEASFVPTSPGELRIPAPTLAFAHATRFEESMLDRRVPVDRADAFVTGEPIVLEVRPLPEEGRPPDFTGAVGSFDVTADVPTREVAFGESLKLALTIRGEGDLAGFDTPSWREIGSFRVLGILDQRTPSTRVLTLDLAPYSAKVWQVPAIPFAYFDPGPPAGYRVARTEPIDVVVRVPEAGGAAASSPARAAGETGSAGPRTRPGFGDSGGVVLGVAAAALAAVVLVVLLLVRRRA
jgi:hypothetical protein